MFHDLVGQQLFARRLHLLFSFRLASRFHLEGDVLANAHVVDGGQSDVLHVAVSWQISMEFTQLIKPKFFYFLFP